MNRNLENSFLGMLALGVRCPNQRPLSFVNFLAGIASLLIIPLSHGQTDQGVTLDMPWPSSPPDDQSITLSEPPERELSALADGTTGFFTVTARNVLGLESLQSRQISYATPPLGAHKLTVINGTGSGIYSEGTRVRVSANQPAADKQFDRWARDYQILENPCSPVTTALMLFRDLTIEATYGAVSANGKFP